MIYIYDGTWDGFLTAVHHYYYDGKTALGIESVLEHQPSLFDEVQNIATDTVKAKKVENAILTKISCDSLDTIQKCFFSDIAGREGFILNYIKLGFKVGSKIDSMLGDSTALSVIVPARKLNMECHRMLGMLRFELIEGNIYYAKLEPDHNIITYIAPHFQSRFQDQNFIIHDMKRNLAAMYNTKRLIITYLDLSGVPSLHKDEMEFQELWKNYYKHIAIKSRINPKLQKQMMPKRYWKHMVEKK